MSDETQVDLDAEAQRRYEARLPQRDPSLADAERALEHRFTAKPGERVAASLPFEEGHSVEIVTPAGKAAVSADGVNVVVDFSEYLAVIERGEGRVVLGPPQTTEPDAAVITAVAAAIDGAFAGAVDGYRDDHGLDHVAVSAIRAYEAATIPKPE